jgi:hypothetical protein
MSVDADYVARTLDASRRAHVLYRQQSARMTAVPGATPIPDSGSPADALTALRDARNFRMDADAADPDHTAPAWAADVVPHAELMAYYTQLLG